MTDRLNVIIIAGPNGAGKTTFARECLSVVQQFWPTARTTGLE
ncbi:hypothetical protein [Halothiobacillus sp.]|nr:hypothetical protein [Halothiobacillus sp.]